MATLQNIRKRGPLVAIVIGFALLAFVLTDLINSGSSLFTGDQNEIAQIGNQSVSYQEYASRLSNLQEVYKIYGQRTSLDQKTLNEIQKQTWEQIIQHTAMYPQYQELGIGVEETELVDMVQGQNLDPMVVQFPFFRDPNSGQFSRAMVTNFIKNLDHEQMPPEYKTLWLYVEKDILNRRLMRKYSNIVAKGLNATSLEAQYVYEGTNKTIDFNYVYKPYSSIPDNEVEVSSEDLENYYDEYKEKFKQEEQTRDVEYVLYVAEPSRRDIIETEKWINKTKEQLAETEDDEAFVRDFSEKKYDNTYYAKGEGLPEFVDTLAFDAEIGDILGPVFVDNNYVVSKIIDKKELPDSVKAKHILVQIISQAQQGQQQSLNLQKTREVADSLEQVLANGGNFAELAKIHSIDKQVADSTGDLGWFTQSEQLFTQEFNDSVFLSQENGIFRIEMNYGIHLVKIENRSEKQTKVKVGSVYHELIASEETRDSIFDLAKKFAFDVKTSEEFNAAVQAKKLTKRFATGIREMDASVSGLENPRELVKWAYEAKEGEISGVMEFGDRFIVAHLIKIRPEGYISLSEISNQIKAEVVKRKKAEKIMTDIKGQSSSNLNQLAKAMNTEIDTATAINFSSIQVPGVGIEPQVIGTAMNIPENQLSKPIRGINGVFVISVTSIKTPQEKQNYQAEKMTIKRDYQSRSTYQAYEAIKKSIEIVDKRSKFY